MAWEVSEYKTISIELQSRDQDYTVDSEESAWLYLYLKESLPKPRVYSRCITSRP